MRHPPVFTRTGWCNHIFFGGLLSLHTSEVFLRELISNANDALEKLRLTSLTHREVWDRSSPLNITLRTYPAEDGSTGRIVITGTFFGLFEPFHDTEVECNRQWYWHESGGDDKEFGSCAC